MIHKLQIHSMKGKGGRGGHEDRKTSISSHQRAFMKKKETGASLGKEPRLTVRLFSVAYLSIAFAALAMAGLACATA
ncbi:hypothetical protein GTHT12_02771 [Geobacillus thermodenitrificans]|nr:hypothetical protein GTHT12_02771 [Geobacillus thermodenitrificans]